MAEERNETWVYFALAALGIAYLVYRSDFDFDFDPKVLRRLGSPFAYLIPTVFAVLFGWWQRRQAAAALEKLEGRLLNEGLLAKASGARVRLTKGSRGGAFRAEIRLTRAALYVVDAGGRRGVMRYPFRRETAAESAITDVRIVGTPEKGRRVVVEIVGPETSSVELSLETPERWWGQIRSALGRSTEMPADTPGVGEAEEEHEATTFPWLTP